MKNELFTTQKGRCSYCGRTHISHYVDAAKPVEVTAVGVAPAQLRRDEATVKTDERLSQSGCQH